MSEKTEEAVVFEPWQERAIICTAAMQGINDPTEFVADALALAEQVLNIGWHNSLTPTRGNARAFLAKYGEKERA